jgi:alpha-N-arabinofuranosidase
MKRREFLRNSAVAAGAMVFQSSPFTFAQGADARIEVLLDETLGEISPNIYGHFVENLSGVVYDGIWVGEKSKVPNINGIRKELIDEMRKIKPPIVRFPGGCFADSYDWRDGVGPEDKRPRRTNFWHGGEKPEAPDAHRYDPNRFGTNEFVQFCRLLSAEPYLAANLRSLPAEQLYRWVEYCNSPAGSTSLADDRAASGFKDPFKVRYWGIGNESWGCGGNFTAQEYAVEYRRFTAWVPSYPGMDRLAFIASGPNDDHWDWTRGFLEEIVKKGPREVMGIYGLALHYYAWNLSRGKTNDWVKGKGDAVNFDASDWYELLQQGDVMESLIKGHWQVMGEFDHEHHIKLVVDEWGPWYRDGSGLTPTNQLEQLPTLRDAVFSGLTLDTFNRHPEKVEIGCCAQLINCLNSLYLAHEDKFCVTPVGHTFALYGDHQGGQGLRTEFSSPTIHYDRDGKQASFWGLNGSASLHNREIVLTAVNPSLKDSVDAQIAIRGARVNSGSAVVLTAPDIHARNTFEQRQAIAPRSAKVQIKDGTLVFNFPAASVAKLNLQLA